jgi:DNA-binding CsgD family transcriptional regulator
MLLDRQTELERLASVIDAARHGSGGVILIEGESGIGKSALLGAAAEMASASGLKVLSARGGELEVGFGYGLMRQLLEREIDGAPPERARRLLAGAATLAFPIVAPRLDAATEGAGAAQEPFAIQHGLYWLLSNLADEYPLALVLDDLHWADAATLRFLVYLARRLDGVAVAVLGALRLDEEGAWEAPLQLLRSEPLVQSLEPAPLSEESVGLIASEILAQQVGSDVTRAALEVSGGNPFLLSELLHTVAAGVATSNEELVRRVRELPPPSVSRSVLLKLARTSENAVALSQAIAVLGASANLYRAAALAGLSESAALAAADKLIEARILAPGRPLEFRHPLLRTAVYSDPPAPRRTREHKRAARLLADDEGSTDAVAGQLLLTEPAGDAWVVTKLREAAAGALARTAPEAAVEYLTRCLAEPPAVAERAGVLLALGSARFHAGDRAGLDVLGDALDLATDPRQRAMIALELGSLLYYFGDIPQAVALLEGATSRLDPTDPLAQHLEATLLAIAGLGISTHGVVDKRLAAGVEEMPGKTPNERLLLATLALRAGSQEGPASRAASIAERALGGGKLFAEQPAYAVPVMFPVCALIFADEFDAAGVAIRQHFGQARARGSLLAFSAASWAQGWLNHRLGALADAETDLRISWSRGLEGGWQDASAAGTGLLIEVLVDRGEISAAEAVLSEIDEQFHASSTTVSQLFLLEGRGRLRIAKGDFAAALDDLLELGRRCEAFGWRSPAHHRWRSEAALALMQLGDQQEARRLAQEEVDLATHFGAPRAIAVALQRRALLEHGTEAIGLLEQAAAVIDGSPAQLVKATVLIELGAALRRGRARTAAREPLRIGLETAQRCGAKRLAEHARTELQATGARPRHLVLSGADALTPSERRVCELVAHGYSNPEVAQLLFVTRGTVEAHLRSAYRKLDIDSRGELASALAVPASAANA